MWEIAFKKFEFRFFKKILKSYYKENHFKFFKGCFPQIYMAHPEILRNIGFKNIGKSLAIFCWMIFCRTDLQAIALESLKLVHFGKWGWETGICLWKLAEILYRQELQAMLFTRRVRQRLDVVLLMKLVRLQEFT